MDNKLKVWYQFQETDHKIVRDLSGNEFHGTYMNTPEWGIGMIGTSFIMRGNHSAYITIPKGVLQDVHDITIVARVKWVNNTFPNQWLYSLGIDSKHYIYVTPKGNSGKLYSAISNVDGSLQNQNSTGAQGIDASSELPINIWKSVTITIDSKTNTSVLYIDGIEVARNTEVTIRPSELYDDTKDYSGYIGKSFHWDPGFIGEIDDFRIYSRALTEQEIAALTYEGMTDTQLVAAAQEDLSLKDTTIITKALDLPTSLYGTDITWSSSDSLHLHSDGRIFRPAENEPAVKTKLTASISKNTVYSSKDFELTILPVGASTHELMIHMSKKGADISPYLFGLFFEDINYSLDGGLYPELVQNNSFEFLKSEDDAMCQTQAGLFAWHKVETGGGIAEITIEDESGIHPNNPHYLKIVSIKPGSGVGVYNTGFPDAPNTSLSPNPSICLIKDEGYNFSFFARSSDYREPIEISVTSADGLQLYACARIEEVTDSWEKYNCILTPNESVTTARLQIVMKASGTLYIDMVSLFPQKTWNNRPNGIRLDLGMMLSDMKPKFFRFPGGCLVEGRIVSNRYRWKDTVGPLEYRKSTFNNWAFSGEYAYYNQSYGFGFYEYFQLAEDLFAEPIPCINAGISHPAKGTFSPTTIPMEEMGDLVQDAIDLIEFANGTDINNEWVRLRMDMGHPKPFHLKYLEIGNENGGREYYERYQLFSDAIKAVYPEIKLIVGGGFGKNDSICLESWSGMQKGTVIADLVDEHYYMGPGVFYDSMKQYDNYDRSLGKVFLGEYASWGNTLENALAEAAYMMQLEENGDVVELAAYAPLLAKKNYTQWGTNAIFFDNTSCFGTVNYYVQQLFMKNTGDYTLSSELVRRGDIRHSVRGAFGFCTEKSSVQIKDVKILDDDSKMVLIQDNFSYGAGNWTSVRGSWSVVNGMLEQADQSAKHTLIYTGNITAENYTISLSARKTGGSEGFIIILGMLDERNYLRYHVGGWNNTRSAFEKVTEGQITIMTPYYDTAKFPMVTDNEWYNVRIIVRRNRVICYINDHLHFTIIDRIVDGPIYSVVSQEAVSGDIIMKMVNPQSTEQIIAINLIHDNNIKAEGSVTVLKGTDLKDANTFEMPVKLIPVTTQLNNINTMSKVKLDPYSLSLFRFQMK